MYVKVYNKILDSSIADNRKLRHFFIDLLLCSDPDGNVIMTKRAISNRIGATMEEVEWGICELMKPDPSSDHSDEEGRRIIPLEGHGYGWKIVQYRFYRDMKSAKELREESAERVRRFREKKRLEGIKQGKPLKGELTYVRAMENGETEEQLNKRITNGLPQSFQ